MYEKIEIEFSVNLSPQKFFLIENLKLGEEILIQNNLCYKRNFKMISLFLFMNLNISCFYSSTSFLTYKSITNRSNDKNDNKADDNNDSDNPPEKVALNRPVLVINALISL